MLVNMTGGKRVENIINEIVAPDLLWTNPSPTSAFNPQTVSLDLSKYAGVLIEIAVNGGTNKDFKYTTYLKKNSKPPYGNWFIGSFYTNSSGTSSNAVQREVQSITNGGVKFGYGKSGSQLLGDSGIPTRIWGAKFTL